MLPSGRTPSGHVAFAPVHVAPLHWRNFTEVLDTGPSAHAALIVRLTGHLYHIETRLREQKAGPALCESERAWRSAPLVRDPGGNLPQGIAHPATRRHRPRSDRNAHPCEDRRRTRPQNRRRLSASRGRRFLRIP